MNRKSRSWVVGLLILIFFMPGLSAYWLYHHQNWLVSQTTNKGQLLTPPILMKALNASSNEPKWGLVLWSPGPCRKLCQQQLNKLSRIRVALGRRYYSVQLFLLIMDSSELSSKKLRRFLRLHHIQSVVVGEKAFSDHFNRSSVFIADPNHYLILSYALQADPADIFNDLKHLIQ